MIFFISRRVKVLCQQVILGEVNSSTCMDIIPDLFGPMVQDLIDRLELEPEASVEVFTGHKVEPVL